MRSYDVRTADTVWSPASAHIASACQASAGHTVRSNRDVHLPAKTEESASETHPTRTSTAAAVPCTSLDDTVRTNQAAPIRSVSGTQGTKCVTTSATTMNVSGTEETAHSTGSSRGLTAPPVFPAGIALGMAVVIRSVTTPGASSTALSARRHQRPSASM